MDYLNEHENRNRKNVIWLGWTSFFTDISSEMIFPVLPIFLKSIVGAPFFIIGFIDGLAEFISSFLKYLSGLISDVIQKRKILAVIGYSFSAISKLFLALANSWFLVLILRSLDRLGKGIRTTPRDALIAESVPQEQKGKYFGLHRAMDSAGAFLGVGLAILILYFLTNQLAWDLKSSIRIIFILAFVPALIGVILLLIFVKDVKRPKIDFSENKPKKHLFNFSRFSYRYYLGVLVLGILSLGNVSYSFFLLKSQEAGIELFLIPVFYLIYNLFYALTSYPAGKISDKIGRVKSLAFGFFVFLLALLGAGFMDNIFLIGSVFILFGFSVGITDAVSKAFVSDLVKKEAKAESFGLYYGTSGICTLIGNSLTGFLWDTFNSKIAFLVPSLFILIGILMLLFFFSGHSQRAQEYGLEAFKGYR